MLERSRPRPSASVPRTSRAKIVMSAWLWPKTESEASIARMRGRIALARTYRSPPTSSCRIEPRDRVETAGMRIASRATMIAK